MAGAWRDPDVVVPILAAAALSVGVVGLTARFILATRARAAGAALVLAAVAAGASLAGGPGATWMVPLALAGICFLSLPAPLAAVHRATSWAARPVLPCAGLLATGLVLAGWVATTAQPATPPTDARANETLEEAERRRALASLREIASPVARTDRGRRVRLHVMSEAVLPQVRVRKMEEGMARDWGPTLQLIRTGPPDGRSDCHGWVFAAGRYWIVGADVELVLQDNGYRPTTEPAVGDLVVYRDAAGLITHTGVLYSAPPGGHLLVQSKWSWLGTYLHPPDGQPYGGQPAYYRASRNGHRLAIEPAGTPIPE